MSMSTPGGTRNSQEQIATELVDLKVKVPLALRRKLNGIHGETGKLMSTVAQELLEKGLAIQPSDEQVLASLFRRHLPRDLYNNADSVRASSRQSWTQLVQLGLAALQREQTGQSLPVKPFGAVPVPRVQPKSTAPVTVDIPWDSTESDTGIRRTAS